MIDVNDPSNADDDLTWSDVQIVEKKWQRKYRRLEKKFNVFREEMARREKNAVMLIDALQKRMGEDGIAEAFEEFHDGTLLAEYDKLEDANWDLTRDLDEILADVRDAVDALDCVRGQIRGLLKDHYPDDDEAL